MARKALGDARVLGKQLSVANGCGVSCETKRQYLRSVNFQFYRQNECNRAVFVPTSKPTGDVDGGRVVVLVWFCVIMAMVDLE